MAAAGYTTDLSTLTAMDTATQVLELTLTGWTDYGTQTSPDTDIFIQNTGCTTFAFKTGVGGAMFNNSGTITIPTDGAILIWHYHAAPNTLQTESGGGIIGIAGNSLGAFHGWYLLGSDTYTYGGWNCFAFTPGQVSADGTGGSPTGVYSFIGIANRQPGTVSRGNPVAIDAMRVGRCAMMITGGDLANGYANFASAAAYNDSIANRYGLFQAVEGGYKWQGLLLFGSGSTAVDFRDANKSVVVANTKKVTANFNTIEVRVATSRVDMTAINFSSLGTVSRGRWITTDNATINLTNCGFTDFGTLRFQGSSTLNNVTFRRTGQVEQSGATVTSCTFDSCRDAVSLIVNAPDKVGGCTFVSDGGNHAMQITSAGTFTMNGFKFTGYVAGTGSSSTGNEVIYNTSNGAVTCSVQSGDAPSIRNSGSSTTLVVTGQKTLTVAGMISGSEVRIYQSGTTTEITGIETADTSWQYTYTYVSDVSATLVVFNEFYLPIRMNIVLGGSNQSIPVQQIFDRQYQNL